MTMTAFLGFYFLFLLSFKFRLRRYIKQSRHSFTTFPNTSNSPKILCYTSYFQRSSRCLKVKSVVKLWYITSPPTNNVKQDRWRLLYLLTCTLYLFYEETASQGQFLLYRNWKMKSRNHYSHQICFYQHLISIKHKRFWYPHKIVGEVIVFKVFFLWLSKVKIT